MVCSGAVVNRELWKRYRHGERGNASLERGSGVEPRAGSRGRAPSGVQGQSRSSRSLGEAPMKLNVL